MISWDKNVRMHENQPFSLKSLKRRLRWRRKTAAMTYCIAYSINEENLLDIYNMGELIFKYYSGSDIDVHIIGVAGTRDEACELASSIIEEVYNKTGGVNIRKYFSEMLTESLC